MVWYWSGMHRFGNLQGEVGLAFLISTPNDPLVEFVFPVPTSLDSASVEY